MSDKYLLRLVAIFQIGLLVLVGTIVSASQVEFGRVGSTFNQLIIEEEGYKLTAETVTGDLMTGQDTYWVKMKDSFLEFGFKKHNIRLIEFDPRAGGALYYLLNRKAPEKEYSNVNGTYVEYLREDMFLGVSFTSTKWNVLGGGFLAFGRSPFVFQLMNGSLKKIDSPLTDFGLTSEFAQWKGSTDTIGVGYGGYFAISYQINSLLKVSITGDNLASNIVWTGNIEEYLGLIDFDIKENGKMGFPIQGKKNLDASLEIQQTPVFGGSIAYSTEHYQIDGWINYRKYWEEGVKATVKLNKTPDFLLGISYQNNKLLYQLGFKTPFLEFSISANAFNKYQRSDFKLELTSYLF